MINKKIVFLITFIKKNNLPNVKKKNKKIFFSKLLLAIKHYSQNKKLSIINYNKLNLLDGMNKYIYNSKFQISSLIKNKNFTYIPNTFVKNIKKKMDYIS